MPTISGVAKNDGFWRIFEEFCSGACDQYIKSSRSKAREIENRLSPYSKIVIFLRPKEKWEQISKI